MRLSTVGYEVEWVFIGVDGDETAGFCVPLNPIDLMDGTCPNGRIDPAIDLEAKDRLDDLATLKLAGHEAQMLMRPTAAEQENRELGEVRHGLAHHLVEHDDEHREAYVQEMLRRVRELLRPAEIQDQVRAVAEELLAYRVLSRHRLAVILATRGVEGPAA